MLKKIGLFILAVGSLHAQIVVINATDLVSNSRTTINNNFAYLNSTAGVEASLGFTPLNAASNLGDIINVVSARSNLGLGTFATLSVPGSNTQLLFNNSGSAGASANLTFDGTNLAISTNYNIFSSTNLAIQAQPTGTNASPNFIMDMMPATGGTQATLLLFNAPVGSPNNTGRLGLTVTPTYAEIVTSKLGTGTAPPLLLIGSLNNDGGALQNICFGFTTLPTAAVCTISMTPTSMITAVPLQYSLLYSAAGTPLPTCNSGSKGSIAEVTDATTPSFLGAYVSGGAVVSPVTCNGSGWVTY